MSEGAQKLRIDKWLWQARFFKTRSLAAKVVAASHCRVNGVVVAKPAFGVGCGDVLTFPKDKWVRVIRVEALGTRRGPAPEAQALYHDLDPPRRRVPEPGAPRFDGGGRPGKRDRRALDQLRGRVLE